MSCVKGKDQLKAFERFLLNVNVQKNGCWEWTGKTQSDGYAAMYFRSRRVLARRWIYMFVHGEIPAGCHIIDSCNNRICVNPLHMQTITHAEQLREQGLSGFPDRVAVQYKITDGDAAKIRSKIAHGVSMAELARQYGVSRTTIYLIKTGELHNARKKRND